MIFSTPKTQQIVAKMKLWWHGHHRGKKWSNECCRYKQDTQKFHDWNIQKY